MDYSRAITIMKMILDNEYDNGHVSRSYTREDVALMIEACEYDLDDHDDGQPTWEQEWLDFGEVYSDE
jgi:hypothetical protein